MGKKKKKGKKVNKEKRKEEKIKDKKKERKSKKKRRKKGTLTYFGICVHRKNTFYLLRQDLIFF
jgi:hypothetical protein